jgi:phage shock protein C
MSRFKVRSGRGLYRSRNGVLFGVCRGLADYFNFKVFWVRCIAVAVLLLTGIWPLAGIYILAALLMKPEPVLSLQSEDEEEFYHSYVDSRRRAAQRLKNRYRKLDRRIRRLEDSVTSHEFDWDRRLNT